MPTTFQDLENVYKKWLFLDHDPDLLRIVFATVIANRFDGKPVWIMLAGPSGSGKTAAVLGLVDAEECYRVSSLTPAALASGSSGQGDTFLHQINGKVLIITDFSTINSMDKAARDILYSFFREAYDGSFSRRVGNRSEAITWRGRFGIFACTTTAAMEKQLRDKDNQELGERFLIVRMMSSMKQIDDLLEAKWSNADKNTDMEREIREVGYRFLKELVVPPYTFTQKMKDVLMGIAKSVARLRSQTVKERGSKDIIVPTGETIEVPTRLLDQIKSIAAGLAAIGTDDDHIIRIMLRIARDICPINRTKIIEQYIKFGAKTQARISQRIGISAPTVNDTIEEMCLLGICQKDDFGKLSWYSPFIIEMFTK